MSSLEPIGEAAPLSSKGAERVVFSVLLSVCILCAAVGTAVALCGFTWGLPNERHIQSYHPDEQNVTYSLRNMDPAGLDFDPRFFGNPTFHTYQVGAAALAASLAGVLPREMSEEYWLSHPRAVRRFYIIGRALSMAYALLSVWVIYLVAARLTGRRWSGVVAALILLSLPVTAVHSHYMTVNSSAVFWALLTVLFALKLRENPTRANYIFAGVFAGLAVSTKLNNAFLPLGILAAHLQGRRGSVRRALASGRLWACAAVCIAAFFIGSPYYLLSYGTMSSDPHNRMNLAALLDFSSPLPVLLRDFWNHISGACGRVMAAVLLASLPLALARCRKRAAPILAVAVPFLLLAVKSGWWAFASRLMPLLALLVVLAAALLFEGKTARRLRPSVAAAVICGLLLTIPWNLAYANLMRGEHTRSIASLWIKLNVPEGAPIIVLETPYFDDPDIIYENALHPGLTPWPSYEIVNLDGLFDELVSAEGDYLVVPQRFEGKLRDRGLGGITAYAESNGFALRARVSRTFGALGQELRDWVPADMVQDYPVFIFQRASEVDDRGHNTTSDEHVSFSPRRSGHR
jgi:hypothetical protein